VARRAWLEKKYILNAREFPDLLSFLRRRP